MIRTLFAEYDAPKTALTVEADPMPEGKSFSFDIGPPMGDLPEARRAPELKPGGTGLPSLKGISPTLPPRRFVLTPQFPLSFREIAQDWRRLRRPVRVGPATELDIEATIARRAQSGVASPVALRPRRTNTMRLLILCDRQGSMAPYHAFCAYVCEAIRQAGRLERVAVRYFHNTPVEGADPGLLNKLARTPFPTLDAILPDIAPFSDGFVYDDPDLLEPHELSEVLRDEAQGAAVIILSDAGAGRGHYNVPRLFDTLSFVRALRLHTARYVWLNPALRSRWKPSASGSGQNVRNTTATQLARHLPMFPLTRPGMQAAVEVLRGRPYAIERPL